MVWIAPGAADRPLVPAGAEELRDRVLGKAHRHAVWHGTMGAMSDAERVCPFCGEPPGPGVFCAACGRNLSAVERLPTRAEWGPRDEGGTAEDATAAFLQAMGGAGAPGRERLPCGTARTFRRAPTLEGWIVRPVERDEDNLRDGRYEPGLFLTVDGTFHRLDNEVRGWGQRDFPQYHHTVDAEPVPPPARGELRALLAAVRARHGV